MKCELVIIVQLLEQKTSFMLPSKACHPWLRHMSQFETAFGYRRCTQDRFLRKGCLILGNIHEGSTNVEFVVKSAGLPANIEVEVR